MLRFAPTACLFAVIAAATPALAGGIAQVPTIGQVSSAMNSRAPFGNGSVSGVGMNVSNADGVTVQTNIDASRNVQAGTSVTINRTINGVAVGSGAGGDFLAGADAQAQDVWAQKQAYYQQLQNGAALVVQVWQGAGY
jgi:putative NIF3 family GTP cyclohydrolase 1 type 2